MSVSRHVMRVGHCMWDEFCGSYSPSTLLFILHLFLASCFIVGLQDLHAGFHHHHLCLVFFFIPIAAEPFFLSILIYQICILLLGSGIWLSEAGIECKQKGESRRVRLRVIDDLNGFDCYRAQPDFKVAPGRSAKTEDNDEDEDWDENGKPSSSPPTHSTSRARTDEDLVN